MMEDLIFVGCAHCAHFVGDNPAFNGALGLAQYVHLEDGEQEFDHEAKPGDLAMRLSAWKKRFPALFELHPDGKIGPNSTFFKDRRGKLGAK